MLKLGVYRHGSGTSANFAAILAAGRRELFYIAWYTAAATTWNGAGKASFSINMALSAMKCLKP